MPFYLVTQTSLIEAEDENAAARKSIDNIRSGSRVTVTVKFDETSVSHITVAAKSGGHMEVQPRVELEVRETSSQSRLAQPEPAAIVRLDRKALLKRIMADALTLARWPK